MELPEHPVTQFVNFIQNPGDTPREKVGVQARGLLGHVYTDNRDKLEPYVQQVLDQVAKPASTASKRWGRLCFAGFAGLALFGGIKMIASDHWSTKALFGGGVGGALLSVWLGVKRSTTGASETPGEPVTLDVSELRRAFNDKAFRGNGWIADHQFSSESQFWPEYGATNAGNHEILKRYREAYGHDNVGIPQLLTEPEPPVQPDYDDDAQTAAVQYETALGAHRGNVVPPENVDQETIDRIRGEYEAEVARQMSLFEGEERQRVAAEGRARERRIAEARLEAAADPIQRAISAFPDLSNDLTDWHTTELQRLGREAARYREGGDIYQTVMAGGAIPDTSHFVEEHKGRLVALQRRFQEAASELSQWNTVMHSEHFNALPCRDAVTAIHTTWVQWIEGSVQEKPKSDSELRMTTMREMRNAAQDALRAAQGSGSPTS